MIPIPLVILSQFLRASVDRCDGPVTRLVRAGVAAAAQEAMPVTQHDSLIEVDEL